MCGVFILSVQCVLQPVLRSKAVVVRGLKETCLPARRDKKQLAGLPGVRLLAAWSVEELHLFMVFTSNCNAFSAS